MLRLEQFLPYRLSVTSNRVSALIAEAYDRLFGLSIPEWRVITVLAEAAPLSQLAIVGQTRMDKMTVSRAVRPLVERVLVSRGHNADDRRSHLLRLTEAGEALYARVAPEALAMERMLLEGMAREDVVALERALTALEARATLLSRSAQA